MLLLICILAISIGIGYPFPDGARNLISGKLINRSQSMLDLMELAASGDHVYDRFEAISAEALENHQKKLKEASSNSDIDQDLREIYKSWLADFDVGRLDQDLVNDNDAAEDKDDQMLYPAYEAPRKETQGGAPNMETDVKIDHSWPESLIDIRSRNPSERYFAMLEYLYDLKAFRKYIDGSLDVNLETGTRALYESAERRIPLVEDVSSDFMAIPELPHLKNLTIPYMLINLIIQEDTPEVSALREEIAIYMDLNLPNSVDENDIVSSYRPAKTRSKDEDDGYPFLYIEFVFGKLYYIDTPGLLDLICKVTSLKSRLALVRHNMGIVNAVLQEILFIQRRFDIDNEIYVIFPKLRQVADQVALNFRKLEPIVMLANVYMESDREDLVFDSENDKEMIDEHMINALRSHLMSPESIWIPGLQELFTYFKVAIPHPAPTRYIQRIILNELNRMYYTYIVGNCLEARVKHVHEAFRLYGKFIIMLFSNHRKMEEMSSAIRTANTCFDFLKQELTSKQDIISKRSDRKLIEPWNLLVDKKVMKGKLTKKLSQCFKEFKTIFERHFIEFKPFAQVELDMLRTMTSDALKASKFITSAVQVHQINVQSANEIVELFNILSDKYRLF